MLYQSAKPDVRPDRGRGGPQPLVYVIDDEAGLRESSCFLIATLGLSCIQFRDGDEFLAEIDNLEPGCILLDVAMKRMDGLAVQDELIRRGIHWPIVFMSGSGNIPNVVKAIKKGAIEFLEKPFEEERLLAALHRGFVALRGATA